MNFYNNKHFEIKIIKTVILFLKYQYFSRNANWRVCKTNRERTNRSESVANHDSNNQWLN